MTLLDLRKKIQEGVNIFDLPLRVTYYARVSTDKKEQLNSLDNQTGYYEDYINKNPNWVYIQGYIDEGVSGKSVINRLGFLNMINDGKDGKFDLIITKEISRFARDTLDSIQYTRELLSHGVGVYFQSDNINTLMPDAELRLTIMASLAQDELRKLSERLRFGYKRSIENGKVLGQTNMLGYNKADGILTINEEQAKIVKRIFEIYNEGRLGVRSVARQLEREGILSPFTGKMLSPETIKSVITNPKYKGYYCSGKTFSIDYRNSRRIRVPTEEWNVHKDEKIPAIVSEEVWDKANRLYQERSKLSKEHGDAYQSRYTFSGKIFCAQHGTSYHRHVYHSKSNGDQEVWNCKLYRQKGKIEGCDSPTIYSRELMEILGDIYSSIYKNKNEVINGLMEIYSLENNTNYSKDKIRIEKELEKYKAKKDMLLDLLMEKSINKQEFTERNESVNKSMEIIFKEYENIKEQENLTIRSKENLGKLRKALENEFNNGDCFSEEMTQSLLDKIIVHKIDGDKKRLKLEIYLSIGSIYTAELSNNRHLLSQSEIGISQAQVSRLEKGALDTIKSQI